MKIETLIQLLSILSAILLVINTIWDFGTWGFNITAVTMIALGLVFIYSLIRGTTCTKEMLI